MWRILHGWPRPCGARFADLAGTSSRAASAPNRAMPRGRRDQAPAPAEACASPSALSHRRRQHLSVQGEQEAQRDLRHRRAVAAIGHKPLLLVKSIDFTPTSPRTVARTPRSPTSLDEIVSIERRSWTLNVQSKRLAANESGQIAEREGAQPSFQCPREKLRPFLYRRRRLPTI